MKDILLLLNVMKSFNSTLLFMFYAMNDSKWLVQDLRKVKYAIVRLKDCPKFYGLYFDRDKLGIGAYVFGK